MKIGEGFLYTMGSNFHGRLGLGDQTLTHSSVPCLVESLLNERIMNVSCGTSHTIAITDIGDAFSWGLGEFGALGNNDTFTRYVPSKIDYFAKNKIPIVGAACGSRHSIFMTRIFYKITTKGEGFLYGCGAGDSGQLGNGKRELFIQPIKISTSQIEPVISIAAGCYTSFVINNKGAVFSTGANNLGQLGLGHKKSIANFTQITALSFIPIKKVSAGNHSAALSNDGDLYFWGTGVFGEILTPQKVGNLTEKVKDVEIGASFGIALGMNGKVWTWGANTSGELGVGDYEPRVEPYHLARLQTKTVVAISCGGAFAIALGVTHGTGTSSILAVDTIETQMLDTKKMSNNATMASPNGMTAQFAPSAVLEDSKSELENFDQGRKMLSEQRSDLEYELSETPAPMTGNKISPLGQITPSISDLNGEISSSISQRDPNSHLLNVLTKQRDYLEETLEKERKEKKKLEDTNAALRNDIQRLKNQIEQIENIKQKESSDANLMLTNLATAKQRLDEMEAKILELENNNELLTKLVKEKDTQLGESNRGKEELQKKYESAKKKLRAHIESQGKLAKENDNLMIKMKKGELEHGTELEQLKETNGKQAEKIIELENQLNESKIDYQKISDKNKEYENDAINFRENIDELQSRILIFEKEKEDLTEELTKQKNLATQYENDLKFLEKEFDVIKNEIEQQNDSIKSELSNEKCKNEDLAYINQQQIAKITELENEKNLLGTKITQLEEEIKDLTNKLTQFKKLNEELEERNYKLMDTLHQDVAKRSKQYKGKTLAALAQSEAHKVLNQMKEPVTFGNEKDGQRTKAGSPPQNLLVEATDDIAEFETMRKSSKQSPTKEFNQAASADDSFTSIFLMKIIKKRKLLQKVKK